MKLQNTQIDAAVGFNKPWGNYLLEKIVETQAPEKISWWPQTLAWQVLLVLAVLFILSKTYRGYKSYQRNLYRREALKWLAHCKISADEKLYRQLPQLLRKTAMAGFKRSEVTLLSGKSWDSWLDKHCSKTNFTSLCPNLLYQIAFADNIDVSSQQYQTLITQISLWVSHHRRQDD